MKSMYSYLEQKPWIGFLGAIVSKASANAGGVFTNEHFLSIGRGVAVYAGALVAVCTAIVWLIKTYDTVNSHFKPKQK